MIYIQLYIMFKKSILFFNLKYSFTLKELRKKYLKYSLKYHPDKTKNNDESNLFLKVNEYNDFLYSNYEKIDILRSEYTNNNVIVNDNDINDYINNNLQMSNNYNFTNDIKDYKYYLREFIVVSLERIFKDKINNNFISQELLRNIIDNIFNKTTNYYNTYSTNHTQEQSSSELSRYYLSIYNILNTYKDLLNIPDNIYDIIKDKLKSYSSVINTRENDSDILETSFDFTDLDMREPYLKEINDNDNELINNNIYVIETNVKNILNHEIYVFDISNTKLFIPLWYKDLCFDNEDNTNKVFEFTIHHNLPKNMVIDYDHNITITIELLIVYMLKYKYVNILIGDKDELNDDILVIKKDNDCYISNLNYCNGYNDCKIIYSNYKCENINSINYYFETNTLYIKKYQNIVLEKQGIGLYNDKNIHKIVNKGDVCLNILID